MENNKTKERVEENIGKVEVSSRQGRMGFNKGWSIEGEEQRGRVNIWREKNGNGESSDKRKGHARCPLFSPPPRKSTFHPNDFGATGFGLKFMGLKYGNEVLNAII
jgi:hypothetical protein